MVLSGGHQRIDERSLAMHRAIAEKLRARPGLLAIARENLDRWQDHAGRSLPYLEEWRRILSLPFEEMLALIGRDDARMTALRQSSPFAGILEPAERWAIFARFESARFESARFESARFESARFESARFESARFAPNGEPDAVSAGKHDA